MDINLLKLYVKGKTTGCLRVSPQDSGSFFFEMGLFTGLNYMLM